MKILVCVTNVPDTTTKIAFVADGKKLDTTNVQFIVGPYDDYALARAVEIKEQTQAELTVLNVGEASSEPMLRKCLAIGADKAIRVDSFPIDSFFVAHQISEIAKRERYDLILMGKESIDYNGGVVHGMVGELLGIPTISPVMKLDVEGSKAKILCEVEGGKEEIEADFPLVLGCQEPIAEWKIPNMKGIMTARSKPLEVVPPAPMEAFTEVEIYNLPAPKGGCKYIPAENAEQLIELLRTEAKVL